jgi:hypothetical protein
MSVSTAGDRHARLVMEHRRNRLDRRYRRLRKLLTLRTWWQARP